LPEAVQHQNLTVQQCMQSSLVYTVAICLLRTST
jgi:hypothetical protein